MEIKAKVSHNFEASKALAHITVYKKRDPKKRFIFLTVFRSILLFIVVCELFLLSYVESFYGTEFNFKGYLIIFVALELFFIATGIWSYCFFPKVQYNSLGKMKDIVDEYLFSDESLTDTVISEEYNEKTEIRYTMILHVYETSRYFFIANCNSNLQ